MRHLQDEVRAIVGREGLVARRDHPELASSMDWLLRVGELCQLLPGVYARAGADHDFLLRVDALRRWAPDAVLTGASAARFTFWSSCRADVVECALRRRGTYQGFGFTRRAVPEELVTTRHGVRVTVPALTALDLGDQGTDAIDQALRTRSATLPGLWDALRLTSGRRGNRQRLEHLLDSRDEPWSQAERLAHRLLREAGIRGWKANLPVVAEERLFYLDVAFRKTRVAVEIDGRLHEDDPDVFENDRWRQNALVLDGWVVLRFTWAMLTKHPEVVVDAIERALRMRELWGRP